jgi:hypothetical protein
MTTESYNITCLTTHFITTQTITNIYITVVSVLQTFPVHITVHYTNDYTTTH